MPRRKRSGVDASLYFSICQISEVGEAWMPRPGFDHRTYSFLQNRPVLPYYCAHKKGLPYNLASYYSIHTCHRAHFTFHISHSTISRFHISHPTGLAQGGAGRSLGILTGTFAFLLRTGGNPMPSNLRWWFALLPARCNKNWFNTGILRNCANHTEEDVLVLLLLSFFSFRSHVQYRSTSVQYSRSGWLGPSLGFQHFHVPYYFCYAFSYLLILIDTYSTGLLYRVGGLLLLSTY